MNKFINLICIVHHFFEENISNLIYEEIADV